MKKNIISLFVAFAVHNVVLMVNTYEFDPTDFVFRDIEAIDTKKCKSHSTEQSLEFPEEYTAIKSVLVEKHCDELSCRRAVTTALIAGAITAGVLCMWYFYEK